MDLAEQLSMILQLKGNCNEKQEEQQEVTCYHWWLSITYHYSTLSAGPQPRARG